MDTHNLTPEQTMRRARICVTMYSHTLNERDELLAMLGLNLTTTQLFGPQETVHTMRDRIPVPVRGRNRSR